jgi:hypothetical protein
VREREKEKRQYNMKKKRTECESVGTSVSSERYVPLLYLLKDMNHFCIFFNIRASTTILILTVDYLNIGQVNSFVTVYIFKLKYKLY